MTGGSGKRTGGYLSYLSYSYDTIQTSIDIGEAVSESRMTILDTTDLLHEMMRRYFPRPLSCGRRRQMSQADLQYLADILLQ